jgi:hypothetical protein
MLIAMHVKGKILFQTRVIVRREKNGYMEDVLKKNMLIAMHVEGKNLCVRMKMICHMIEGVIVCIRKGGIDTQSPRSTVAEAVVGITLKIV